MQRSQNNQIQFKQSNYDLSVTPSSATTNRQVGSYGFDLSDRRNPLNNSFLGGPPASFSNENDLSVIQKSYLSVKLMNEEENKLPRKPQQATTYPKLIEKSVTYEQINYIKISRVQEETPFFWNQNSNQNNLNQNYCYEVAAKDQFGKILSRKKIYSKQNQDLEQKMNEISFMKGFKKVQAAHFLTALSQMQNSYKNLKNSYYIQKMDDGEYHGTLSNNNIPNGIGIYYYNDGSVYQGEMEMRSKHHKGIYQMTDGSVYDGGWVNDKMCGEGTLTDPQKNVFKGYFKDGVKEGKGKIIYANGAILEGNWANGYEEGQFLLEIKPNNFEIIFAYGNITYINGVSIDKIPKDSSQYTFIHISIFPQQIVINEYLKPVRVNFPQKQIAQKQQNPFLLQQQSQQRQPQQQIYQYNSQQAYQYQSPNLQIQQNLSNSQNKQLSQIKKMQDYL